MMFWIYVQLTRLFPINRASTLRKCASSPALAGNRFNFQPAAPSECQYWKRFRNPA
jgi:hypothetical protein